MDVAKAAFNVIHDGDGGSAAVAQLLGKRPGTIDHEANPPRNSSAKLGLLDALKITRWRRDYRILYAFADECGHLCVPANAESSTDGSTSSVLNTAAKLSLEIGTTLAEMNQVLADGEISPVELARFEAEVLNVISAHSDVVRAMRTKMQVDLGRHHQLVEEVRRGQK